MDINGGECSWNRDERTGTRRFSFRGSCDFLIDKGISLCKESRVAEDCSREGTERTSQLKITRRETRSFPFDVSRKTQGHGFARAHDPREVGRDLEGRGHTCQKSVALRNTIVFDRRTIITVSCAMTSGRDHPR